MNRGRGKIRGRKGKGKGNRSANFIQILSGVGAQDVDVWESQVRAKRCNEKHFENGNGSGNEEAEEVHGWGCRVGVGVKD